MSTLTRIGRILTGLIFVFSGFVKGVDPMGTAFKIGDYLTAFGMDWLDGIALPLSLFLCLVEFVTGMMLITGSMTVIASWMAALFMALFTPLTLVLAIYNPVSDCGCFGDAIVMTNWQTFFKNIVITLLVVFVFARRRDRTAVLPVVTGLNATVAFAFLFLLFMRYNLAYLPVIDFRPYSTGTSLPEAMAIPPDAEPDKYDIRFVYEKDGVQQEFTLNNYPANDTAWKFIDQKSVLISRGYVPPIHDFTLVTEQGLDMTDQVTGQPGDVMLMIARDLKKSDREGLVMGYDLGLEMQKRGVRFHIVTATPPDQARGMVTGFDALYADDVTLKTVIRSDPGFVLLHNGTITGKWSYHNLPGRDDFYGDLNALALRTQTRKNGRMVTAIAILTVLLAVAVTLPFSVNGKREEKIVKQ
jgi:uncharacterized membrane protein YphA (DoxX/SURF4 family)